MGRGCLAVVAVFFSVAAVFAWSLCRAAAIGDREL